MNIITIDAMLQKKTK